MPQVGEDDGQQQEVAAASTSSNLAEATICLGTALLLAFISIHMCSTCYILAYYARLTLLLTPAPPHSKRLGNVQIRHSAS
jgi:hypothetical protein